MLVFWLHVFTLCLIDLTILRLSIFFMMLVQRKLTSFNVIWRTIWDLWETLVKMSLCKIALNLNDPTHYFHVCFSQVWQEMTYSTPTPPLWGICVKQLPRTAQMQWSVLSPIQWVISVITGSSFVTFENIWLLVTGFSHSKPFFNHFRIYIVIVWNRSREFENYLRNVNLRICVINRCIWKQNCDMVALGLCKISSNNSVLSIPWRFQSGVLSRTDPIFSFGFSRRSK